MKCSFNENFIGLNSSMKFIMVMIICFGADDCTAIYNPETTFEAYDTCYYTAKQTTAYMQELYPMSSGEIHCFDEEQFALYEQWLNDGDQPGLLNPTPQSNGIDA